MDRDAIVKALVKGLDAPTAEKEVSIAPPMTRANQIGHALLSGDMDPLQCLCRVEDVLKYAERIIAGFQADYRARIAAALHVEKIAALVEAVISEREGACQDVGLQLAASDRVDAALAAFRGDATGGEVG